MIEYPVKCVVVTPQNDYYTAVLDARMVDAIAQGQVPQGYSLPMFFPAFHDKEMEIEILHILPPYLPSNWDVNRSVN